MKVTDIKTTYNVSNINELNAILTKRYRRKRNSYWMTHDKSEYPTLALMVNEDSATLTFVLSEFDAGFAATRSADQPGLDEAVEFSMSENSADDVFVSSELVLPLSRALTAVREFYTSAELPASVEWTKL